MSTSTMVDTRQRIVVADVDETIISIKSMLRFARYLVAAADPGLSDAAARTLDELADVNAPRHVVNEQYYTMFRGVDVDALMSLGHRWFEFESAQDGFYNERVVADLRTHRSEGAEVWLISGSLDACVAPIAADLNATGYICTTQQRDGNRFTGSVCGSRIGAGKGLAVVDIIGERERRALDIWAYADHHSDISMLSMADHIRCVNPEPRLSAVAAALEWEVWRHGAVHEQEGTDL